MIMKKIVKPYKARKSFASTDVPSFVRGKDQILKSPARLQRRKKNELGEFDDGKNGYIPSNKVRRHIADWEASDFAKQNKQFGGDAISVKAEEFNNMLGDYATAISQDMADGLFSTFYNLSPSTFEMHILPAIKNFADYPSNETYNSLDSIITNRYNWAKDEHKNGIMRRAKADAEFFNPSQIQQRKDRITKGKLRMLHNNIDRNVQNYLTAPNDNTRVNKIIPYKNGKDDNSLIKETAAYNAWRQTLPKNLQRETPTYDLYGAYKAGLEPGWVPEDKSYHLGSRDPKTGRILKRPTHPTFGKAIWSDMSLGYYPIYRDGEIYTEQPIKYVDISKYKGGKDEPWYDKLNDSSVGSIIKLIDPTGVSSYYDVYKAGQDMYNNPSWSNAGSLAIETLGAIPLVGKFGKVFKLGNKLIKNSTDLGEDIGKEIFNWLGPRLIPTGKDIYDNHQSQYNKGKDSGIHIKKKNRGKFTALKKRTGKSASWFKEHGTPAQKKMAVFALNARKWKH